MNRLSVILLLSIQCFNTYSQKFHTNPADLKSYILHSKILNEDRTILVYKPEIFPEFKDANPPIIYIMDGGWFGDLMTGFVNLYCEKYNQLPPIWVVGIANSEFRDRDYRPFKTQDINSTPHGGADKFMEFLTTEVIPDIEKDKKTPTYRVIAGHSLGGVIVLHAFSHYAAFFDAAIATSPSLQENANAYVPELVSDLRVANPRKRKLFMSMANETGSMLTKTLHIDSVLVAQTVPGLSFQFLLYPQEDHISVLHRAFFDGFRFVFPLGEPAMEHRPFRDNYALLEEFYMDKSAMFGFNISVKENAVNKLGYRYMDEWKDIDGAMECFRKNIELYPSSGNAYDSYGEALMNKGDKTNAMLNYKKSLILMPENENAREMLKKLGE